MTPELTLLAAVVTAIVLTAWVTRLIVRARMSGDIQGLNKQVEMLEAQLATAKSDHLQQMEQQTRLLREQIENATQQMLRQRAESLQQDNARQMAGILAPLQENLNNMHRIIESSKESNTRNASSLEKAIDNMFRQTQQLGLDAQQLTKALSGNSKVQGDWGEMLLERILEESGLRRDNEFVVQSNVKDEAGKNLRPDVIVNCPGGRHIIIDSKVSLTAYHQYVGADNEIEQKKAETDNFDSLKKHVDELAAKQYHKLVPGTIDTVLMFVPNEGSYILALRKNPQLGQYAFRKGVLIINPTNLMLALQIIYNLWQSERQNQNIERIIKQSADLYDKFVTFSETFLGIGTTLRSAQEAFDKAHKQLSEGKGNIVRRLEGLKDLGVSPSKQISDKLKSDLEP